MSFPKGTVTFLFTDVVGSTALWERHPAAMRLMVLTNMGNALCREGNHESARILVEESLVVARELGERHKLSFCFEALALIAFGLDDALRAARIWGGGRKT